MSYSASRSLGVACCALPLLLAGVAAQAQGVNAALAADVSSNSSLQSLPVWEAGVVLAAGSVPDYPASDRSSVRALALPLFVYRGPVLRVEDGGVRGRLFSNASFEVDLSAAGAFNARNNEAREGMPGLDYLFQIGPQAVYRWELSERERISAHLKTRAVFSTDFGSVDYRGLVIEPQLRWSLKALAGSAYNLGLSASAAFGTERLHDYFYEVAPQYARPDRPAFDASAGYLGSEFGINLNRKLSDTLRVFVGARLALHGGAANQDSPLFRDNSTVSYGVSLLWTPWRSEAVVQERERDGS